MLRGYVWSSVYPAPADTVTRAVGTRTLNRCGDAEVAKRRRVAKLTGISSAAEQPPKPVVVTPLSGGLSGSSFAVQKVPGLGSRVRLVAMWRGLPGVGELELMFLGEHIKLT
jgi:hypothetical protein